MSNILICLEKSGIGGVETAVVNQAIEFQKNNNNVYILAQEGEYKKILEENGIKCINFKTELESRFDIEKIKYVLKIIKENEINQVHIHQLSCILNIWPACIIEKIPYIFYIHTTVPLEDCKWFEGQFPIYKNIIKAFYENASKIVCITKKSKEEHNSRFTNIKPEKYIIVPNSINFEQYKSNTKVEKIKNFLILSRLSKEKVEQIKRSINLFNKYQKEYNLLDIKLDIVGDGNQKQEIEEYIQKNDIKNVKILPGTNNVEELMNKYDAVIGIGRCILEAIAMKRIVVLSGFYSINGLIDKTNIAQAMEYNFVGKNMPEIEEKNVIRQIYNLNNKANQIQEIIEQNYNYLYENRNIQNNIFYLKENVKVEYNLIELFNIMNLLLEDNQKEKEISEKIWIGKQWLEERYSKQKESIKEMENIIKQINS